MNKIVYILVVALVLVVSNIVNIYAYFYEAKNATVILSECSENCKINGTLRIKPFNGMYYLITKEENIIELPEGSYDMIILSSKKLALKD